MRLLCNGVALDLLSWAALSFKKSNPLFAFDALTCERTQSFDIPATPHNERVMQLAKLPAFRGEGMRRRFEAELQDGAVVKRGYLHVDKFSKDRYKVIFVTGELLGLQNIKNLGKIADIIQCSEAVQYGRSFVQVESLPQHATETWGIVKYVKNGSLCPSMRIMDIVDKVTAATGIQVAYPRTFGSGLRVIVGEPKGMKADTGQIERDWQNDFVEQSTTLTYPVANTTGIINTHTDVSPLFGIEESQVIQYRTGFAEGGQTFRYTYKGRVQHIVAKQPMSLTFPETWPETMYIGRFVSDTSTIAAFQFLGDRSFTKGTGGAVARTGEELKGRSINLVTGDKVTIVREDDFYNDYESGTRANPWFVGWKFSRESERAGVELQGGSIAHGDIVRLQDNLPDMTFVDLLKTVAAATGFVLNYTDGAGVTFDSLNFAAWEEMDMTGMAVEETDTARTFGDYAQENTIRYSSDDSVPDAMRIRTAYTIVNDNLERQKDLLVFPFSEGRTTRYEDYTVLEISDTNTKDILASTQTQAKTMVNVLPAKVARLQTLCDASTSVNIKVRMTLAQYERMSAKTAILYNGTRYVWTEATWSKDVATLKLSKI